MKAAIAVALFALVASNSAFAAPPAYVADCQAQATEKKLSGDAKSSFMKKCKKDADAAATKMCDDQAKEKKLTGAAMLSFVNKCVKEAPAPAK